NGYPAPTISDVQFFQPSAVHLLTCWRGMPVLMKGVSQTFLLTQSADAGCKAARTPRLAKPRARTRTLRIFNFPNLDLQFVVHTLSVRGINSPMQLATLLSNGALAHRSPRNLNARA